MSSTPINSAAAWHTLDVEKALEVLKSDRQAGLTTQEAAKRLEQYGPNELEEAPGRSTLAIIWDQFKNIMLLMLILVAIVSAALDLRAGQFPKDAIAISAIVILNGILGYVQESRAEKALAALKRLASAGKSPAGRQGGGSCGKGNCSRRYHAVGSGFSGGSRWSRSRRSKPASPRVCSNWGSGGCREGS